MKFKNKIMLAAIAVNQGVLSTVYAATDTAQIDGIYNWILEWIKKVGVGVVIWGIFNIALAYKSEDSHAMEKAIKTAIAGIMVMGIDPIVKQFM